MWIALTESWMVLSGLTGYVSLGHAVFYGLGALCDGADLAGAAAAGWRCRWRRRRRVASHWSIGYPVLRVRGPYFVILTFGLAELVKYIVINIEAALGKFGRLMLGAPA